MATGCKSILQPTLTLRGRLASGDPDSVIRRLASVRPEPCLHNASHSVPVVQKVPAGSSAEFFPSGPLDFTGDLADIRIRRGFRDSCPTTLNLLSPEQKVQPFVGSMTKPFVSKGML